jgi:hypothetical protein
MKWREYPLFLRKNKAENGNAEKNLNFEMFHAILGMWQNRHISRFFSEHHDTIKERRRGRE